MPTVDFAEAFRPLCSYNRGGSKRPRY